MKKRVLFVDDESLVLEGLQRMLRNMRNDWEMIFVTGGAEALEIMSAQPVDVVVADMRMPGMNGAELLNEVMKRHPQTVRFILSGHADKDLIMKCVGSTHQYLSKPCESEALRAAVLRASSLGASLQNEKLKRLVGRMDRLPSLPSLYFEIIEKLKDPEAMLEDVGHIIARDIGMTAKILKLVNSAFFGLQQSISNLNEAISFLGLNTIKTLVLCINAFSQYEGVKLKGLTMELLWTHSLTVAAGAKRIAQMESEDNSLAEESFVAGMLHDTGQLILLANYSEQYQRVIDLARVEKLEMVRAEERVFGVNHAAVGGYLLGLWGLPVPVVEAIALHHNLAATTNQAFSPLVAVHVADVLALKSHSPKIAEVVPSVINLEYLEKIGLADRVAIWEKALCESV
jgi:HD-like signal output (HDOD) protein/CheY-like chemotaxis protein